MGVSERIACGSFWTQFSIYFIWFFHTRIIPFRNPFLQISEWENRTYLTDYIYK